MKREHRRSYVYEPCDIRSCSTAAAAAVLPLLHCADAFDSEEVWFGTFPRCGQDGTPTYYAKTHAEAPPVAVTRRRPSSTATVTPWLPQPTATKATV